MVNKDEYIMFQATIFNAHNYVRSRLRLFHHISAKNYTNVWFQLNAINAFHSCFITAKTLHFKDQSTGLIGLSYTALYVCMYNDVTLIFCLGLVCLGYKLASQSII